MRQRLVKKAPVKTSRNEKGTGALFLAIGFAAVLSICVLAYERLMLPEEALNGTVEVTSHIDQKRQDMRDKIQDKLPIKREDMRHPSKQDITGRWFTTFGKAGIAEITMAGDLFELIYTQDPKGRVRQYVRGKLVYDEKSGKATLYPSRDLGPPKAISGVVYKILTMRHYDVFISRKQGDNALYFMPPEYAIASKNIHPLFLFADYNGAPVLAFSPVTQQDKK